MKKKILKLLPKKDEKTHLNVFIDPVLKAKLKRLAKKNKASFGDFVEAVLTVGIEE